MKLKRIGTAQHRPVPSCNAFAIATFSSLSVELLILLWISKQSPNLCHCCADNAVVVFRPEISVSRGCHYSYLNSAIEKANCLYSAEYYKSLPGKALIIATTESDMELYVTVWTSCILDIQPTKRSQKSSLKITVKICPPLAIVISRSFSKWRVIHWHLMAVQWYVT